MSVSEDLQGIHEALENLTIHIAPHRLTDEEWAFLRILGDNLSSLAEQADRLERTLSLPLHGGE